VVAREVEELQCHIAAERDPEEAGGRRRELVLAELKLGNATVAKNHITQIEAADVIDSIVRQCEDGDRAVAALAAAEDLDLVIKEINVSPYRNNMKKRFNG
jgi:hypothetical protein